MFVMPVKFLLCHMMRVRHYQRCAVLQFCDNFNDLITICRGKESLSRHDQGMSDRVARVVHGGGESYLVVRFS